MNRISPDHPCFGGDHRIYRETVRRRYLARRERTAWLTLIASLCTVLWLFLASNIHIAGQPVAGLIAIPIAGLTAWAFVTLAEIDKIKNP